MLGRVLVFFLMAAAFFLPFSVENFALVHPSRTMAITWTTFFLVYILMTRVYGGFDVGVRKSRPIIFSLGLSVFAADFVTHLFLCIMNTTQAHNDRFVYEQPLLLLGVFVLQVALIIACAYGGNGIYFHFVNPQRCLVVHADGADVSRVAAKVAAFRRQYRIDRTLSLSSPELKKEIDRHDAVFLCGLSATERLPLIEYCYSLRKDFYYTLEICDLVSLGGTRVMFDDTSMIHSSMHGLTPAQAFIKRSFDLICAAVATVVALPIMLVTAIAIKCEDGGSVFYTQPRATLNERVFSVIKSRSLTEEAGSVHRSVTKDDDRITRVGRVIRKFRIDELPQLFNVLKGDMSFVGPRPEMVENVAKYTRELPEFSYRLWTKAGLTGLAQIYGRYNTSPREKLMMDMTYIEQYSLLLDIRLLLRTVMVLLTPDESTEAFDRDRPSPGADSHEHGDEKVS